MSWSVDRRRFLLSLGAAGAAGVTGFSGVAGAQETESPGALVGREGLLDQIPFDGVHQAGILDAAQPQATFVALDSLATDRRSLILALQQLSVRIRELTTGGATFEAPIDDPPIDSGILGPVVTPDSLSVTVAIGASLFDERYGLAARRPVHLVEMPRFPNDVVDPAISGGDLLLQICAHQRDTVVHAFRELLRVLHGSFQVRWTLDGFQGAQRGPTSANSSRNLFAFRDGTANPDTQDGSLMSSLVWVGSRDEPPWSLGGTYQIVRIIRMHVEFWDRVGLREQQTMIGRVRDTGAPLGGTDEFQDPDYPADPAGSRIPLNAHIRLANPRTPATADQRILRRGFNYHRGMDQAGTLDEGLIFCAFNQDPTRQFATIQNRLAAEPMIDYITPVGGGYFFAPRGTGGRYGWIGEPLFAV
jgi:deferrochelatase/peroxidase EfeB